MAADDAAQPPNPDGVSSYDELAERLRRLRTWSGVTYRELHRRVVRVRRRRTPADVPSYNTVYRCLQPGRTRVDVELVVDIATSLLGETAAMSWRAACQAIERRADSAAVVDVSDNLPPEPDAFTGRETELADAVRTTENPDSPRILTIEGMAGSGKTTLAVRAARTFAKSRGPVSCASRRISAVTTPRCLRRIRPRCWTACCAASGCPAANSRPWICAGGRQHSAHRWRTAPH